jgi:hypothetical protein
LRLLAGFCNTPADRPAAAKLLDAIDSIVGKP